jgi:hypothetical protein
MMHGQQNVTLLLTTRYQYLELNLNKVHIFQNFLCREKVHIPVTGARSEIMRPAQEFEDSYLL